MSKDFFEHKASRYEDDNHRTSNVENIANTIIDTVAFEPAMHLMDFGSGTGLLLERIAPYVKKITAIDISKSMNEQLATKQESLDCELDIKEVNLVNSDIHDKFDGIISSMAFHHIEDIVALFNKFYVMLNNDGFIAIADIDTEDGSFHQEDTGVYHLGFDRDVIANAAKQAGFKTVLVQDASVVYKPQGEYSVFLLTAKKS